MSPHTQKIIDELCNYLGYDCESPMCKELHEHVLECEECQQYIDSIKMTVKICKKTLAQNQTPVPDDIKKALLSKIKSPK